MLVKISKLKIISHVFDDKGLLVDFGEWMNEKIKNGLCDEKVFINNDCFCHGCLRKTA